jgi:hypothetical protein
VGSSGGSSDCWGCTLVGDVRTPALPLSFFTFGHNEVNSFVLLKSIGTNQFWIETSHTEPRQTFSTFKLIILDIFYNDRELTD